LTIRAVGTRVSRRGQNHCQTDHENFVHFSLSYKTTLFCHLFNTASRLFASIIFIRR
jgi:hypothetical protein